MPERKEKESKLRKKINQFYEENELASLESNKNRARSFTVGTAFGGIIEVSMRGDHHSLWCTLQPVEAVEFIEQLAAAAGLQVALRPKQDFSTWRGWQIETENKYWIGSAHWQLMDDGEERKQLEQAEKKLLKESEKSSGKKSTKKRKKQPFHEVVEEVKNESSELIGDMYQEISEELNNDVVRFRDDAQENMEKIYNNL